MNMQEAFDAVVAHLRKQNSRSIMDYQKCAYRGREGKKCAVGALILDEHYSPELEGMAATKVEVLAALQASGVDTSGDTPYMLKRMQSIHDSIPPLRLGGILSRSGQRL